MKRIIAAVLALATMQVGMVSCFGGFGLTRSLYSWNATLSNKWVNWIVFLILYIIPVYGIALLVDVLVLNSVEFWTGKKLVQADQFDEKGEYTTTETKGDEQVIFQYKNYGEELHIQMYKAGQHTGNLVMYKSQPGVFYTADAQGMLSQLNLKQEDMGEQVKISVHQGDVLLKSETMSRAHYLRLQDQSQKMASEALVY